MATTDVGQSKKKKNNAKCFSCCLGQNEINEIPIEEPKNNKENNKNNNDSDINNISNDILAKHNFYRTRHRVPTLALNQGLTAYAQNYAENLANNNGKVDSESEVQSKYGINIYHFPSETGDIDGSNMVKNWYDEIRNYDFSEPKFSKDTSQFTQVIWKDSRRVGVGFAKSSKGSGGGGGGSGGGYIVVIYEPPGNILNQFKNNIFPQKIEFSNNTIALIEFTQFEIECLEEHNKLRFLHNCPPLQLNSNLCKYAQEWVNQLSTGGKSTQISNRRPNCVYGENIYCSEDDLKNGLLINSITGGIPVNHWYTQIMDYDFRTPKYSLKTEHFSQLIWKNSTQLGVAKSQPKYGRIYVVANYDPPGNRVGQFKENVLPITLKMDNIPIVK